MTSRAFPREKAQIGEGISTAVLLAFLLLSVSGSIVAANWTDGLGITAWSVLGGFAFGVALAKFRRVPGWMAYLAALGVGVPATLWLVSALLPGVMTFQEKLIVLQERLFVWTAKVISGGVGADGLIFVIQVALLVWLMAFLAAWFVYRRHQVWGAILPTGAGILFNIFYAAPQTGLYFGLYVLCALLLIVRLNLHTMEQWWRTESIGYTSDINVDFLFYGVVFSVVLMFVAWLLPASAPGPSWLGIFEPLQTPWQDVEDQFTRVFSSLRAVARPAPTAFFGTTLSMGGPVHLGNRPIMDVQTKAGRYWRAAVYDKYTGIGWLNTHLNTANFSANDPRLGESQDWMRVEVTQTYRIYLPDQNILYAMSLPVLFDQPIEVRYDQFPALDANSPSLDVAMVRLRRPLRESDTYTVVSAISVADEDSLREAPTAYSPRTEADYLQLPDALPERVRELAQTITAGYSNSYDKATAIEQYLRSHVKYNEDISAPPAGRDGVDYTLFDRPEGYCNYYASAMTVLARAVGIPARIASGYSLGEYGDGAFHVVEANAHSWVEVYFPRYGWIEFEPTSSKPEIERPHKAAHTASIDDQASESQALRKSRRERNLEPEDINVGRGSYLFGSFIWNEPRTIIFSGIGLAALLAIGVAAVMQYNRMRRMARLAPAARFYEELLTRMRWLGVPVQTHATPFERARVMGQALPQARAAVDRATSLYVRERFAARPLDEDERKELSSAWGRVRVAWWRALLSQMFQRVAAPFRQFYKDVYRAIERWGKGSIQH